MIKIIALKHRWEKEGNWILDIPYLELPSHESLALVGGSGCGKSTFLALLAAWITPTEGEIWIDGVGLHLLNSSERAEWRLRNLAWQGSHHQFFDALSVPENLAFYFGIAAKLDLHKRLSNAQTLYSILLNGFQLTPQHLKQTPVDLSLGELQRLQVMRACLQQAPLTLLDEPSSHLDQSNRKALAHTLFSEEVISHQGWLIIATHDLDLAQCCDQIIYLNQDHQDSLVFAQPLSRTQSRTQSPNKQEQQTQRPLYNLTDSEDKVSLTMLSQIGFAWLQFVSQKKLYATLMLATALAVLLPYFVSRQIQNLQLDLSKRAQQTPLVIGALNSKYDLFFTTIYFTSKPQNELDLSQAESIFTQGIKASPIVIAPQINQSPLVGTDRSYYSFRQFKFIQGRAPHKLGEVCLSESQAQAKKLSLGLSVQTSPSNLFQLNAPYPIDLKIVGIFRTEHPSDQSAYFTTLESAWASRGYAHSHRKVSGTLNDSLVIDQNLKLEEFHLHGDPDHLPVSLLITHDSSEQHKSLLKAKIRNKYKHLSTIDPKLFSKRTLDFTEEIHVILKPLFNLASSLSLALILLMLSLHYQGRYKLRLQLLILGLKPSQVLKLSLLEYMFFIIFALLILVLGLVLIEVCNWIDFAWIKLIL